MKSLKSNGNYCFVYGSLESDNIVIGTGSYSYNELAKNTADSYEKNKILFYKFFQRISNETDEKYHEWLEPCCYSLSFYGFSFGINDYDLIRELLLDCDSNGIVRPFLRNGLQRVKIYYLKQDKENILLNLTVCLSKDIMNNLKKILELIPVD